MSQLAATTDLLERRRWIATQAEWIARHSRAGELGRRARRAYLDRLQIRQLERVAESCPSPSILLDYVKIQVGKQPVWRRENFGLLLLEELERLSARLDLSGEAGPSDLLELCRLYVRHLAASYAFSIAVDVTAPRPPSPSGRAAAPARGNVPAPRTRRSRLAGPADGADAAASPAVTAGAAPDNQPKERDASTPVQEPTVEDEDGRDTAGETAPSTAALEAPLVEERPPEVADGAEPTSDAPEETA